MKTGFFLKLARSNIAKNRRFFIPRILSEAGLLTVFYIVTTLQTDTRIAQLHGGGYIGMFMSIGLAVMTLLSVILMLYINSFLMKQRKREFGVYNILGMEKRHIDRVLFHETAISSLLSVALGLLSGVLFYKICSLLICRLLGTQVVLGFYFIKWQSLAKAGIFFMVMDLVTYVVNCITIAKMKPVEMLSSGNVGEREPKVKWIMLLLGILALGGGYYIAVTTESPLKAIEMFFVAVILVIIGTYFLFVSGSIFVLKALKKNQKFYYNKKRMPAVSGLLYRMKQNAVGLASIAILATGVLVMISTTVSLYSGMGETLDKNYPQEYYLSVSRERKGGAPAKAMPLRTVKEAIEKVAAAKGLGIRDVRVQEYLSVAYMLENDTLTCRDVEGNGSENLKGLSIVTYVTEDMYRSLGGQALNLAKNEIAVCPIDIRDKGFDRPSLTIGGENYRVKTVLPVFPVQSDMNSSTNNCYGIVVADGDVLQRLNQQQKQVYGDVAADITRRVAVSFNDRNKACEVGEDFQRAVEQEVNTIARDMWGKDSSFSLYYNSLWSARTAVMGMYGALLFLGILLGFVCLFATALIVYYKQISEGYEDRTRFQIMQKVGMSRQEVRKTINSQVLLVFFLPLAVAGIHLAFAFPILEKLLHVLLLSRTSLFIICSFITFGVFAAVYTLIYTATARTYYKIVR